MRITYSKERWIKKMYCFLITFLPESSLSLLIFYGCNFTMICSSYRPSVYAAIVLFVIAVSDPFLCCSDVCDIYTLSFFLSLNRWLFGRYSVFCKRGLVNFSMFAVEGQALFCKFSFILCVCVYRLDTTEAGILLSCA